MSFANPTPLGIGATGQLDGKRWRIAGRVVLSMQADDGETYYWNEFNLVNAFGRAATLVFEEGEEGPEWKLFTYFEPLRPLTAAEAAKKSVRDIVSLDGNPARITLVDQSRVCHIEGTAPEGVEVGDVANYFNVDTGARMLVASWTGDEIEFFEGHDLAPSQVAEAFNVTVRTGPAFRELSHSDDEESGVPLSGAALKFVMVALMAVVSFGYCSFNRGPRHVTRSVATPAPPPKQAAPPLRLTPGTSGTIAQKTYTLDSHASIEIARVGARHDRHEYSLISDTQDRAYLIQGLTGGPKEWHLFVPLAATGALASLTPHEAATRKKGTPVPLEGRTVHIAELFRSKTVGVDGPGDRALWPALQYGFLARGSTDLVIARWTETGIQFLRGEPLAEIAVLAAFGPGPEKAR